jgi:hypothetical protein
MVMGQWHVPVCCAGITNTSGSWITPAFQLHLSRVDQVLPQGPAAALAGMRFPAALADKKQQQRHGAVVNDLLQDLQAVNVGDAAGS